jgi:LDH2 family malate/lactate/ureidoglycolate dehydrogenase
VFFHFDIATSVVPAGKIEVFARKEIPLPEGWSVGVDGAVNTDANAFLKIRREKSDGGLLPLGGFGTVNGGHKGYALSMLVELMTGVLSGGVTSNHVRETAGADRCSHVFQAIDYGMFGDRDAIENHLSEYLEEVRNSAKADGYERILTQGESEFAAAKRIAREGAPIQKSTYDELTVISSLCGLNPAHILVEK